MSLIDILDAYKNTVAPMHMPGHKRNTALAPYLSRLGADLDVTEAGPLDNLHGASGLLLEEMKDTARLFGSRRAFWLVNGSTCGILAGIHAALNEGDKVICARNCHRSVYHGLQLAHANPVFVLPPADGETGACGPLCGALIRPLLEEHPDAKLLILTSPTYEGAVSEVKEICRAAHEKNIPVLVDEAHGSHLGFGYGFPDSAVHAGADMVVHSLHKTLPSLTQTALLHLNGKLIEDRLVENALAIFETSSPSYLLMSSISGCVELLRSRGGELFAAWRDRLSSFYGKTEALQALSVARPSWLHDPSKLLIHTSRAGITGKELAALLRTDHQIEVEMAAGSYCVAMTGMGDSLGQMDAFADALLSIDGRLSLSPQSGIVLPALPKSVKPLFAALREPKRSIPLGEAAGSVSAETVWVYPPGIPILLPGEMILEDAVSLLKWYNRAGIALQSSDGLLPEQISVLKETP